METLLRIIQSISDFLWGTPMAVALVGTGLYLSIKFKFRYITKIKFHFQNTYGKMFKGSGDGEGTVSGFGAACTAMANERRYSDSSMTSGTDSFRQSTGEKSPSLSHMKP